MSIAEQMYIDDQIYLIETACELNISIAELKEMIKKQNELVHTNLTIADMYY